MVLVCSSDGESWRQMLSHKSPGRWRGLLFPLHRGGKKGLIDLPEVPGPGSDRAEIST